jgi:hypothetical protein
VRTYARAGAVLGLVLAASVAGVAQPALACGCGAMVADSSVKVTDETSIVRYDATARTEEIVMRLSAQSAAADAAWLFPTPSEAKVELGERGWYEELDALTKPRVVTRQIWFPELGGGDGAGAPPPGSGRGGVDVLGERDLGPFRVATLDAKESGALAGWLSANGYRLSPELDKELGPYVARGWKYVAVKLQPRANAALTGALAPLRVSFSTDELVYPMRLSRLADNVQSLHLYVLGAHRVEQTTGVRMRVAFAGRVTPGQVRSPGLRDFLGGGLFMTELVDEGILPDDIDDDYRFTATEDVPYREIVYDREVVEVLGMPAGWLVVFGGGGLLVALVPLGVASLRRRRSRVATA